MISTKEKNINGHDYQVTQFGAMAGIRLAVRIVKTLGPSLAQLGNVKGGLAALMESDTSELNIGLMVEQLLANLDGEGTPKLILDMFGQTQRDRVQMDERGFNDAYAANYMEMAQAIMFIVEVNFGDFFGVLEQGKALTGNRPLSDPEKK